MDIELFTGGYVDTNGYLIKLGGLTLFVDAPAGSAAWLAEKGISPDYLLLTHQHFDHVEDAADFTCPILAFAPLSRDIIMDDRIRAQGLPVTIRDFEVTEVLAEKTETQLGEETVRLLHVPGHSTDSLVFHFPEHETAFVGDTLFAGGIGRSDLPGGNGMQLVENIKAQLLTLPPTTNLLPGHGPSTTPADEGQNPFLT